MNRILLAAVAAIAVFTFTGQVRADYTTTIRPDVSYGTWDGWGCSLCWWANVFGNRDDMANLLFTRSTVYFNGQQMPGLGFNIARYNAGGCSFNSIGDSKMSVSPNTPSFRQINGYWLNWFSTDLTSDSWDWNADAKQRAMLLKAKARGANYFELFSNSPMWWMCYNGNPSGSEDGASDNLQFWNYSSHAFYLAAIASYARDNWGINFTSVEPFNEPSADWWKAKGTQEGCHFSADAQAKVIGYLRAELDKRGLSNTPIAASDEFCYSMALNTWNSFDSNTKAQVGQFNVHGYEYGNGPRHLVYPAASGKRLWASEYGEADATGMSMATNINLDFRWLHNTAWCYWQPFDSGGWGLIQSNPGDNWVGAVNPKYYVLAQYTRHIRPGFVIIDGGEGNTIAAYDASTKKLVIVSVNYETPQWINYNLSKFGSVSGPIARWITQTDSGEKYQPHNDTYLNGTQFKSWFPANTIQTFEIRNVILASGENTYKVTASAGSGGTIIPTGDTQVIGGSNLALTIAPSAGYVVYQVAIDGVSTAPMFKYTFNSITANHTISASFAKVVGVNSRTALTDVHIPGRGVVVWGKVKNTASLPSSFTISDGYTTDLKINVNIATIPTGLFVNKTAIITGIVAPDRTIQAQSIRIAP